MELEVLNRNGEKTGRKVSLPEEIVGITPNEHAVYLDVKRIRNGMRQGTHKAKERSDLSGSGTKLRRQKGTGFARVGDIKSPIFRGGARVFGPSPRDYSIKVNKKVQRLARKSALASKAQENKICVVEDLGFDEPNTKSFAQILSDLNINQESALFVTNEDDANLSLSLRNIPFVEEGKASKLNTYDILRFDTLLLCESSVEIITGNLKN